MLKYDYVNRVLRRIFHRLGGIVAAYPYYFLFIPTALFLVFAVGFFRLSVTSDVEYLYVPTNSRSLKERDAVEKLFPQQKGRLDFLRMTRSGPLASVILEAKDGGSMLRENVFQSARKVDEVIKNITVTSKGNSFKYENMCSLDSEGGCQNNKVFDLQKDLRDIRNKRICITYPFHQEGDFFVVIYALWLGGVTTDENGCVEDAKAIRLMYFLSEATSAKRELALEWEEAFLQEMSEISMDDVHVYRSISSMLDRDGSRFTKLIIPVFYVALPVMLAFSVASCITSDWVTSKPWIGIAAFLSPVIATAGAFGLLLLCGMEYAEFTVAIPFLMIAIGLDDSFVLLSSWRRTDPEKSVRERMEETYAEAAVSITVTSVTNLLSFFIGITTPYRIHRDFFVYGSLSVVFAYISEITFFGGMLALTGYREERNLHALFFYVVEKENSSGKFQNNTNQLVNSGLENKSAKRKELVTFYRDKLGGLLAKPWTKFTAIIIFFLYTAGGIYGLTFLNEGLNIRIVFPPTSYAFKYITKHFAYFSHYPHVIQISINKPLDYSDPLVQMDVEEIISKFASMDKMAGTDYVESWLNFYLASTKDIRLWLSYQSYNISKQEDFIAALKGVFLRIKPFQKHVRDIVFNENRTDIIASRFMVISKDINDGYEEAALIKELWRTADSCKYPVNVHNFRFVVQSVGIEISDVCIRTILTSIISAMVVFILTVPHVISVFLVGIAIVCIEISVMGYMSLWNVGLDIVSSTALIISTGLSVDYLAHISYAYIVSQEKDTNEKMKSALHAAGHPVFQGCFSTILLVCTFHVASAYGFIVLFKIFLLLMLLAGYNALVLLPVSLALCESLLQSTNKKKFETVGTVSAATEFLMNSSSSENGRTRKDKTANS